VHIPLHALPEPPLRATTEVLLAAVDAVLASPGGDGAHLDVETYTWSVLPDEMQPATLVDGIAAELRWVREALPQALAGRLLAAADALAPAEASASGVSAGPVRGSVAGEVSASGVSARRARGSAAAEVSASGASARRVRGSVEPEVSASARPVRESIAPDASASTAFARPARGSAAPGVSASTIDDGSRA
jgi:hypothetical protein